MECLQPIYLRERDIDVPCGRCGFCTSTRKSDWIFKLKTELKHHENSAFITLTYATKNLPYAAGNSQLRKDDVQRFFKRLRKAIPSKIRYYTVGEYGTRRKRPHYHAIIFGHVSEEQVQSAWSLKNEPIGQIHYGTVTDQSIIYVADYVINSKLAFQKINREPPFALMSRRPAIGSNYLTKSMIKWHRDNYANYAVSDGKKIHLPRYFRDKIFNQSQKNYMILKAEFDRTEAMRKKMLKLNEYHSDSLEYIYEMRRNLEKRIRAKAKHKSKF